MRNRILLGMIAFGFSAFLMGSATMAWFTSSTEIKGATFSSGTIEIEAEKTRGWTEGYGNMAPGQTVKSVLTVTNTGTLRMKYRMYAQVLCMPGTTSEETADDTCKRVTSDPGLANALQLTVLDMNNGNAELYRGPLDEFRVDNRQAVVRDGGNALDPGKNHQFLLEVELPSTAGNDLAGKHVVVSFKFDATQPENQGWNQ